MNSQKTQFVTERQMEALRLIRDGKVYQKKFGYGAWRIQGAHPTVVGRVISMKLAEWNGFDPQRIDCVLTDDGKSVLSNAGGETHA